MHLSDRAIETPRLVILGAILFCVLGFAAAFTLPKERTPRVKLPVIIVAVPNPGASPSVNEAQIIRKIEDEAKTLDGLRDENAIVSSAVQDAAVVQFIFDDGVDVTEAKRDVESLINRIKGEFPDQAQRDPGPTVQDVAFEDWPIIQVFVAGGADGVQRRRIAEKLQDQIETLAGVSSVDIFGGLEPEVQIEVDPNRMALYRFTYADIDAALKRGNLDMPSGSIEAADGAESRVSTRTKFASVGQIAQLPLAARNGKQVLLGDVAHVHLGHKPLKNLARYGGEDAAVLLVRAKTDIDVLGATSAVQEIVDRFAASGQGEDTHIGTVRSQAREIHYMIVQLGTSAVYGIILIILILWVFLGWRNASLISLSVPFAILTTAAIMWFTKRSITPDLAINSMTLFAMILVVGMVVDGCIIVGENIYRHRELGRSPVDAAKRGIGEVGGSLVSAYMTTFAAFAPMFLVRGIMGDFMELLPTVVMFALCAAMLVDHFLLPVLSIYVMKVPPRRLKRIARERGQQLAAARSDSPPPREGPGAGEARPPESRPSEQPAHGALSPDLSLQGEGATAEQLEIANAEALSRTDPLKRTYGRMFRYALRHRLLVLFLATVTAVTPAVLFFAGAIGFEFVPDSDMPIIEVYYELPLGSSMQKRTTEVGHIIEQTVRRAIRPQEWHRSGPDAPPVQPVTTIGEPAALNIRLDADFGAGPEFGLVYCELVLAEDRDRSVHEIRQAIVDELPPLPGVIVHVKSPNEGPPVGAPVALRIKGQKNTTLQRLAERAAEIERLVRATPGVYDVSNDYRERLQVTVEPNRAVASLYDLDTLSIGSAVYYALEGVRVGDVDFGGDEEIELRVRNQRGDRDQVQDLTNLLLRGSTGKMVTLGQVADVRRELFPNIIRHHDQDRVVNIRSELREGYIPDDVKAAVVRALRHDLSPAGQRSLILDRDNTVLLTDDEVSIEFGGENEIRDDALEDLNVAMMVAVALMLIILTVKFNSFVESLIVLFSVPLSLVGVSIGLMLCGFYFSISSMIGVVALAGIVVNDAIVLVDFINRLRAAGVEPDKAVLYAGQMRLRPIFLTTVTTIAGLLPLALNVSGGGEFWQPLTITIMFGLAFATLVQLFIIPIACYTFTGKRSGILDPAHNPKYAGKPAALAT